MTTVGGVAGSIPATPQAESIGKPPLPRRVADFFRRNEEHAWRGTAWVAVLLPLAALVFAVTVLAVKAWPAIRVNGWYFLYGRNWTYGNGYGAVVHTDGVAHPRGPSSAPGPSSGAPWSSSLIAIVIALPLSIGAAFALTERLPGVDLPAARLHHRDPGRHPERGHRPVGHPDLRPLAGQARLPDHRRPRAQRAGAAATSATRSGSGEGLLSAGIVLALMIVPIITSTTRDLFQQVPPLPKEGASALGMTDWEVANKVTLPWVRSGIIGATVLGLGRALGETIAVAMIGGAVLHIPANIYQPFTTVAATILTQLDGALTDGTGFAVATLAELALVLAVISVAVNLIARLIISRTGRVGAPGRGRLMTHDAVGRARHEPPAHLDDPVAGPDLPGTRPHHGAGGLAADRRARPRLVALAVERPVDARSRPTGGGLRDQILGTLILMLGVFLIAGTIGVLAGIHLAELARTGRSAGGVSGPVAHRLGHPLGLPLDRARLRRLRGAGGGPALGLLAPVRADHPLHHGHPLHRQDDRELAAPGADGLPGGGRGAGDVDGLRAAQGGAQERAARASSPACCSPWPSPAARRHRSSTRPGSPTRCRTR